MSMHQGMDLSKFKRISGDDKTSTLRHPRGHEIKIAHSGLTPKMRDHLNSMPIHLAEGDEIPPPAEAPETDAPEAMPEPSEPGAEPTPPQPLTDIQAPLPQKRQATSSNDPNTVDVVAQKQLTYGQAKQKMMEDHINYDNEMASSAIPPATYASLFDKKSALGKIGTLFGLMVSGAGSGLAHQSNAVMDMMNKELQMDFDRQKQNRENAKNFVSAQYAHDAQKSDIAAQRQTIINQQLDNQLKAIGAKGLLEGSQLPGTGGGEFWDNLNAQQKNILAEAGGEAKMYGGAPYYLSALAPNNPRVQAMIQQQIKPQVDQKVAQIHEETAQKVAQAATPPEQKRSSPVESRGADTVVDSKILKGAMANGKNSKHFAGAVGPNEIDPDDAPALNAEIDHNTKVRNGFKSFDENFRKVYAMQNKGEAPGVKGAVTAAAATLGSLAGPVAGAATATIGNMLGGMAQSTFEKDREREIGHTVGTLLSMGFSNDEANKRAQLMFPKWNDNASQMEEAHRLATQLFKDSEKNTVSSQYRDRLPKGTFKPFPEHPFKAPKAKKGAAKAPAEAGPTENYWVP